MDETESDPAVEDLLVAAHNYFLRFGYSRVSTDEIASTSGRSKKTLYKHFGAKEELLQAVIERLNRDAEGTLAAYAGSEASVESLAGMLQAIATNVISTQETLFHDLREKQPELHRKARAEREQALLGILTPVLQRLQEQRLLRRDLELAEVVGLFVSTVESAGDPLGIAMQDPIVRRRIALAVRIFIDGLRYGAAEF